MREQRLVFGEVAELYERARPSYPDSVVDRVLELAAPVHRVLEVGAGTGKLTRLLARRGVAVHALEPDAAMTAVGERECEGLPVSFERTLFEDWRGAAASVDLVVAAQSWHWMPPGRRIELAADALRPGGVLALMWNLPKWEPGELRDAIDDVYAQLEPDVERIAMYGFPGSTTVDDPDDDLHQAAAFGPRHQEDHPWHAVYDRERWLELTATQSQHRLLEPRRLERLLGAIGDAIDAAGGTLEVTYVTKLVWARRT